MPLKDLCHGPCLARRLYRLSRIVAKGGWSEASMLIELAGLSACESITREGLPKSCNCFAAQYLLSNPSRTF